MDNQEKPQSVGKIKANYIPNKVLTLLHPSSIDALMKRAMSSLKTINHAYTCNQIFLSCRSTIIHVSFP